MASRPSYRQILKALLDEFFYVDHNGDIQYSYQEDTGIGDINPTLQDELKRLFPEETNG